ncbi:MAG: hypothetical protein IJJ80_04915 [Clostridia bacterium]|nr:hypothetical protein [Clostridia bacterium]
MKQLPGQMSIFDLIEPEVGEYVTTHGAVICHIMRPGYIGKKVVYDVSTQSMPDLCKVGILEKYIWNDFEHCWRSVIYHGNKQRALIDHAPWNTGSGQIYECLPWDRYPERQKAIGKVRREA